jgi:PleD family two-component response regulator
VVLVVEDHADSAEMLRRLLKLSGFNVVVAPTAKEALIVLSDLPIRVAVIDYNLPDHDGVWLLEHMNDDPPVEGVCSIVLSGTCDKRAMDRALAAGASGWYIKGVDSPSSLVDSVKELYGEPAA